MNNLVVRSLSGAVFVAMVLIPMFLYKELAIVILSTFMVIGLIEFYRFFDNHEDIEVDWKTSSLFGIIVYTVLLLILLTGLKFTIAFLIPLIFVSFIIEIWRKKKNPLLNLTVQSLGILYVVVPFFLMCVILQNDGSSFPLLVGMFILIWTNDSFAFLSGKFFGKTKLIERISPNKTWEGTIGGVLMTILGGFILGYFLDPNNLWFWMLSAVIIATCSGLGDLLESLFKRSANLKDSGSIMPGHGGILDRFDAAIFSVPFFLAWIVIYNLFT